MNRRQETSSEVPFAVRLRIIRQRRRGSALHHLTAEALWVVLLTGIGIVIVTQLLGITGKA
jgi:hypothetical protein